MSKLPMSKPNSEKWQRRLFVAKDGFLLYYTGSGSTVPVHFDTKPKGIVPLGGCKVEKVERGPKGGKVGLQITHPDFYEGRMLILAAESAEDQEAWFAALNNCSRVTMENALLGDSMIEKLRSSGTAAEKEKSDAMEALQKQALALKLEQEARLSLANNQEAIMLAAAEAEGRAKKKEEEMAAAIAEAEGRKSELQQQAADMQLMVEQRAKAIADANAEYEKVQESLARARAGGGDSGGVFGGGGGGDMDAIENRGRQLEEEKMRLEREKLSLERTMREMTATTQQLRSTLSTAEEQKARLEGQLRDMSSEDTSLSSERQMRKRLERKLQIAEDSLKRLDNALRKSGVKLDIDVFADVKMLLTFFEERVEDNRRDAHQIDIMKAALQAKRRYIVATARADGTEEADESTGTPSLAAASRPSITALPLASSVGRSGVTALPRSTLTASGSASSAFVSKAAGSAAAPAPAPVAAAPVASASSSSAAARVAAGAEGWESDDDDSGSVAASTAAPDQAGTTFDAAGQLPAGWTAHKDEEGDTWYFNAATQVSSWTRPT